MNKIDDIKINYDEVHLKAKRLMSALQEQIFELLNQESITLAVPLESRIKAFDSIVEKIKRKDIQIECVSELPDLIGFRLILLFNRDQIKVDEIIEKSFKIISREDTSTRLSEEAFGYKSLHYTVNVPDKWLDVPTFSGLGYISVEIQVRTLAQHMWAAASHKLQYKNESNIPVPIRRSINRVAALLETVDLEFERVLDERDVYVRSLDNNKKEKALNVNSIEHILDEELPRNNKDSNEDYSNLIDELLYCGITTSDSLRKIIKKHLKQALKEDAERVPIEGFSDQEEADRASLGVYFTHSGLTRIVLDEEFGDKRSEYIKKNRAQKLLLKKQQANK